MSKKRRDKDFVGDILEAIEYISSYTNGMTYKEFLDDRKTRDAVVRNFEVIGEAAKNIAADFKAKQPDVPWKTLAGFRDKLIHFYFGVDYKIVWNIIKKQLPKLKKQVAIIVNSKA
ncbi:MAG: DUF86 domain-containing protein [Nitrospirae bacterium]|nr:DUF86 domain-containing protein [Nitrospirota bacterium]